MAETLSMISIISFIAAGIMGGISLLFWFTFKIPSVISDLSRRTARRSIEDIRRANEKNIIYKARIQKTVTNTDNKKQEKLGNLDNPATGFLNETTELSDKNATILLESEETSILKDSTPVQIRDVEEVVFIHTKEVIE